MATILSEYFCNWSLFIEIRVYLECSLVQCNNPHQLPPTFFRTQQSESLNHHSSVAVDASWRSVKSSETDPMLQLKVPPGVTKGKMNLLDCQLTGMGLTVKRWFLTANYFLCSRFYWVFWFFPVNSHPTDYVSLSKRKNMERRRLRTTCRREYFDLREGK
jgi:hypothetical protein